MKLIPQTPDANRAARIFGCTVEQAKSLMAKNAAQMATMADKAKRTGKKVNNYTESELRSSAEAYRVAASG